MERMRNPIVETLDLVRERKRVKLSALAYRLGLSQEQVLDILDVLERERAVSRDEEDGEIVIQALNP